MGKTVRIGAAQAFYGDDLDSAVRLARDGNVQYLCFDCLAELTMSILAKDRRKDPELGYTRDIVPVMRRLLPLCRPKGVRMVTNAGGLNPVGAARALAAVAEELGYRDLRIAVVWGDDILDLLGDLKDRNIALGEDTGSIGWQGLQETALFANAYIGADEVARALATGADVVITGRITDSAAYLGIALHEFGWALGDWDRRAQGVLLGHLMECTAQVTGGNFSGRWWEVPDLAHVGFPVAELHEDGSFVLTKPEGSGGLVSVDTVREQFLYEVHDPHRYMTPDVAADFTTVRLRACGPDRVLVEGATGTTRPPTLKAVMAYPCGYVGEGRLLYSWPDAYAKAVAADGIIRTRLQESSIAVEEVQTEYIGMHALHGPAADPPADPPEVLLRIAVRTPSRADAERVGRLFPPVILAGPPHASGFGGMLPVRGLLGTASCLVPRDLIESRLEVRTSAAGDWIGGRQ